MKTIDEAAKEQLKMTLNVQRTFRDGVEFAQRWIPVEEELPMAYETGNWNGKRSDFVLAKDINGDWFKARTYQGVIDGVEFCDFADEDDYQIADIIAWRSVCID